MDLLLTSKVASNISKIDNPLIITWASASASLFTFSAASSPPVAYIYTDIFILVALICKQQKAYEKKLFMIFE